MKRVVTFCMAFLYIIGVFHHPIIFFAHAESEALSHSHGIKQIEHSHLDVTKMKHHDHELDEEDSNIPRSTSFKKTQLSSVTGVSADVFIDTNDYYLLDNKNLVRKTSPPILERNIKNYRYTSLVRIIISHT